MKNNEKKKSIISKVLTAAAVLFLLSGHVTDNILTVSSYSVKTAKLSRGVRIANVSDLHDKAFGRENSTLIKELKKLSPDIIVITGDIVNTADKCDNALDLVRGMTAAGYPVYYASGNHERRAGEAEYYALMEKLSAAGAVVLNDECSDIELGGSHVRIIGIDDWSLKNGEFTKVLQKYCEGTEDIFTAALAHEPQYRDDFFASDCDLVLSGHCHGGQVRIPFLHRGLYAPDQGILPKYTEGIYTVNGTSHIISRGVGNQFRLFPRYFNLPEITVVDILPS